MQVTPKRAAEHYITVHCQEHSFPEEILPKAPAKNFHELHCLFATCFCSFHEGCLQILIFFVKAQKKCHVKGQL